MTAAKVERGRYLFYDKRMSVNGKQSCATCHRQELAFTDGRSRAEGTTGPLHPRSSMSLVNVAYAPALTWVHPSLDSLEEQALVPMLGDDPLELGLQGVEDAFLKVVNNDATYQRLFSAAFPGEDHVGCVLARLGGCPALLDPGLNELHKRFDFSLCLLIGDINLRHQGRELFPPH